MKGTATRRCFVEPSSPVCSSQHERRLGPDYRHNHKIIIVRLGKREFHDGYRWIFSTKDVPSSLMASYTSMFAQNELELPQKHISSPLTRFFAHANLLSDAHNVSALNKGLDRQKVVAEICESVPVICSPFFSCLPLFVPVGCLHFWLEWKMSLFLCSVRMIFLQNEVGTPDIRIIRAVGTYSVPLSIQCPFSFSSSHAVPHHFMVLHAHFHRREDPKVLFGEVSHHLHIQFHHLSLFQRVLCPFGPFGVSSVSSVRTKAKRFNAEVRLAQGGCVSKQKADCDTQALSAYTGQELTDSSVPYAH